MKISNSSQYGLMAVGYVATHPNDGNIMSQAIAEEYKIPLDYLLKVLGYLAKAGILNSKRGPRGGFTLGRELGKITILEIFEAIDGSSSNQVEFLEYAKNEQFALRMSKVCDDAIGERDSVLESVTMADLIGTMKL